MKSQLYRVYLLLKCLHIEIILRTVDLCYKKPFRSYISKRQNRYDYKSYFSPGGRYRFYNKLLKRSHSQDFIINMYISSKENITNYYIFFLNHQNQLFKNADAKLIIFYLSSTAFFHKLGEMERTKFIMTGD